MTIVYFGVSLVLLVPAQYIIAQKYLDTLGTVATGAQKLVFLPYEASGAMAALGGLRELLQGAPQK